MLESAAGGGVPPQEINRHKQIMRTKFYAKLILNGREVGSTDERAMSKDFALDFNWVFSVRVVRWPEQARLQIYEKGLVMDTFVAEVFLAIPGSDGHGLVDSSPVTYQFTSQNPFNTSWSAEETLYSSGAVHVKCAWLPDQDGADPEAKIGREAPPMPLYATETTIARKRGHVQGWYAGEMNTFQLAEWLKHSEIDPLDPRNAQLLDLLRAREAAPSLRHRFRIDVADEVKIGDALSGKKRELMLKYRWERGVVGKVGESMDMKKQMIPLSEHEIHLPDHGIGIEAKVARELTARLGVTKHIITEEALRLLDEQPPSRTSSWPPGRG